MTISRVLILCRGNLCRSPMAAALLGQRLPGAVVRSAGLAAAVGEPAVSEVIALLASSGIDVSAHRAVQVTRSMCDEADLILVMSGAQRHALHDVFAHTRGKVFLLSDGRDVADPYGRSNAHFNACFDVISPAIEQWARRIGSESPMQPFVSDRWIECLPNAIGRAAATSETGAQR
ncbi:low molecular weight protein-tyrosine-phosphatase [Paraburkholderia phymatum]|uniref:Low molecular weight protein-tyrosine-phosphatase n=1 Tax=Paraburkholderia phymatum TaxID=148447 RepID=A0ACC6TX61_9BURK